MWPGKQGWRLWQAYQLAEGSSQVWAGSTEEADLTHRAFGSRADSRYLVSERLRVSNTRVGIRQNSSQRLLPWLFTLKQKLPESKHLCTSCSVVCFSRGSWSLTQHRPPPPLPPPSSDGLHPSREAQEMNNYNKMRNHSKKQFGLQAGQVSKVPWGKEGITRCQFFTC